MNRGRSETSYHGAGNMSLDISHGPDDPDESQEQSQHSSRAEPSLFPWSPTADPDISWRSDYNKLFRFVRLDDFNNGNELGVSTADHRYGEVDLSELPNWNYDIAGMERGDHNIVPRHGGLPSSPMDFRVAHGEDSIKTPNAPLESPNRSPPHRQATDSPPKPFDEVGALFTVRRPTDLGRTTNHPSNSLPRVVILDTTLDNVCEEKSCDMSGFHVNISSTTTQSAANQTVGQILYKSSASSAKSSQFPDVNWHRPNNYEVAMHGRQSPHTVTGGFDPRFGTLAAESVNAFYADADLTISNVAAVSSPHRTYGAKRGGVPRGLSTLQIPSKTPFQNRFRSPTHLIPSSSSRGTAEYPQLQYAYGRDDPPSTPTTPFCASPIELPSPISTSPSSLSDTSEGITRCPSCPDKVFKGTLVAQKNSLQRHRRDAHNGMPRLECLVRGCTVTFAPGRKDNRMKHIRAIHPDYPLPALSTKRKRKADSGLESC
ncbi:MAG: hypothetical protein ASARMPREDX12_003683 [Alectoria sarmentosa]|nr:MAG: hypothetical protein ASARMPREDX12_003683 [Alectoria sarmentosa]